MNRWLAALMMALIVLEGCAHTTATVLASSKGFMCKHCNCLMPSGVEEDAICPVCHCGKPAFQCHRGT